MSTIFRLYDGPERNRYIGRTGVFDVALCFFRNKALKVTVDDGVSEMLFEHVYPEKADESAGAELSVTDAPLSYLRHANG